MSDQPRYTTQLKMRWPVGKAAIIPPLAPGFLLRSFQPGDEAGYIRMMQAAGMAEDYTIDNLSEKFAGVLPGGTFLAVSAEGVIAGSARAKDNPHPTHPQGGSLDMVGVAPAFRGHGLGAVISAHALRRLVAAGYTQILLCTDDRRLAALKTYLVLGWQPVVPDAEHEQRWRAVGERLGIDTLADTAPAVC